MDQTSNRNNTSLSNDVHDKPWESSESEFKYISENICSESNKNINGMNIIVTKSDYELSFKSGNAPGHMLKRNNNEVLFDDIDNSQPLPCKPNYIIEANDKKDCQLSARAIDPFDLSNDDELSQESYKPIKRIMLPVNDTLNVALSNSTENKKLPETYIFPNTKDANENRTNKISSETTAPFDLLSEDEMSQNSYQSVKRNLLHVDIKSTFSKVSVAGGETEENPHGEICTDDAADTAQQNIPAVKRQRTAFRVAYVHSQELLEKASELIRIEGRANLVHSLIDAFGLMQYLELATPRFATDIEILGFHCPDYITFLCDVSVSGDADDNSSPTCKEAESYGLSYDCPIQNGIYETCCLISGATIVAAESLVNNTADVAINWYGGWHHAKRDSASGFCYINDIVLGILKLREKFDRILYVDIDLHHGDGVEEAFSMTPKVMTVSFHKYMPGFFPGSGSVDDVGTGKGKFYSVNVPLLDGIRDEEFFAVFCRVMQLVKETFQPQAVVMQCGADSLSSDPMASFNLTHTGVGRCVGLIMTWNLPILLLGGGGYNFPNTAKCWAFLTSLAVGKKLPLDIPEHEHLLSYGPDFEMSTTVGNRKDHNTKQYLANLVGKISYNLSKIKVV